MVVARAYIIANDIAFSFVRLLIALIARSKLWIYLRQVKKKRNKFLIDAHSIRIESTLFRKIAIMQKILIDDSHLDLYAVSCECVCAVHLSQCIFNDWETSVVVTERNHFRNVIFFFSLSHFSFAFAPFSFYHRMTVVSPTMNAFHFISRKSSDDKKISFKAELRFVMMFCLTLPPFWHSKK